ncbi:CBS domain-containing protein [Ruminococcaceae bacterium YRB3002]|nr:CBS domain-containing protein [Ruminococcaceae bacterium YRB3002]
MNIAFFMIPKTDVKFITDTSTVRQALETMHHSGFTAIPVLDSKGYYKGILREGHLLWYIVRGEGGEPHTVAVEALEKLSLSDVPYLKEDNDLARSVSITATIEELINRAMVVNFVPIVDDRNMFIGIVPRSRIIKHFYEKNIKEQKQQQ